MMKNRRSNVTDCQLFIKEMRKPDSVKYAFHTLIIFPLFGTETSRHPFKALATSERRDRLLSFLSYFSMPCAGAMGETTNCPTFVIAGAISIGRSDAHTLCESRSPR